MPEPVEEKVDLDELTGEDRENALFGGGDGSQVLREDPPEEEEEALEAADDTDDDDDDDDDDISDEEIDEDIDRAEDMYLRMQAMVEESEKVEQSKAPVETPDDKYRSLAEKALDLAKAAQKPEPVEIEQEKDWSEDPSVIAAYRESYPNLEDEDISRLIRQQKVVSGHEAQQVLRKELDPIKQKLEQFEQSNAQRQALQGIQEKFQGGLRAVSGKSTAHAYVANHYNHDAGGSLLGKELYKIALEDGPEAMMSILRSPKSLARVVDGIVFDMESNYGNLEPDDTDGQVESSTVAQVRSPRRQQKRNKKPTTEEADAELRRETFGEARPTDLWEVMQPSRGQL